VPGAGLFGTSGVESGRAAPLVGGPPGVELHTVVDEVPSGEAGDMVPVVLPTKGVGMVPRTGVITLDGIVPDGVVVVVVLPALNVETVPGTVDGAAVAPMEGDGEASAPMAEDCTGMVELGKSDRNDEAGCADSASGGAMALPVVGVAEAAAVAIGGIVPVDIGVTVTVGVPGAICPVGVEQVTAVPGVVGFEVNGSGARVVSATPGWVVAENGLGPLSGDETIAPGVDGRPMAVVPMVDTCARQTLQPASKIAVVVSSKRRIAIASLARPRRSSLS